MEICQEVFGKPWKELTIEERKRWRRLVRSASYYRWHAMNVKSQRDAWTAKKMRLLEALGIPATCQTCGYHRYIGALDFHHKNPDDKTASVLTLSFKKALEEARKCQLICANCHRELHKKERSSSGRPKVVADPLLEAYMRASGIAEDRIAAAMSGR